MDSGTFRYPDLPLPARDIFLDLALTNPGGSADSTVVDLSRFHVVLGSNPVDAAMVLRTPISDPDVDARMAGRIDLADLRRTIKLEKVRELSGTVAVDAAARTRLSWVDSARYEKITARGTVTLRDLALQSEAFPRPLAIREAALELAPRRAELRAFTGTIGSSDLQATGSLDNLLGYLLRDADLRGTANLTSQRFNLDEWRSGDKELSVIPVPPHLDFSLQATVGRLLYDSLTMTNARGRLRVKDQRLTLEDFTVNTLGGEIAVSGFYETTVPARPTFDVALRLQQLEIEPGVASGDGNEICALVIRNRPELPVNDRDHTRLRQLARLRAAVRLPQPLLTPADGSKHRDDRQVECEEVASHAQASAANR